MQEPRELTIQAAQQQMKKGELTARQLVASCLERIHAREDAIHAWVEVYEKEALEAVTVALKREGFGVTDLFVEWYGGNAMGHQITAIQTLGQMAPFFYIMLFFNIVVPCATLWSQGIRPAAVRLPAHARSAR